MESPGAVKVAVIQCELGGERQYNVTSVTHWVNAAAAQGAQVVLIPELFEGPYFCKTQRNANFELARPAQAHPTIECMQELARKHALVLPVSFFERDGPHYYNSLAMLDADGSLLGVYRKSHIPDGPGYQEKFYFRPGNSGFKVWDTRYGRVGVGVCWDQWFPEAARAMALLGADLLLYPTAIGSEPETPGLDTKDRWQRAMVGHAVCNVMPVAAANRVGVEDGQCFYGSSFVADHQGEKVAELGRAEAGIATVSLDITAARNERAAFGFFRDRRPDLYGDLLE